MARTKLTEAQRKQRAEYTRLRDIARKRIQRAHAKGKLLDVQIPPTLKEIDAAVNEARKTGTFKYGNEGQASKSIGRAISKEKNVLKKFLQSEGSTAAGRKNIDRKRLEGYKRVGYTNITESNEQKFAKFMKHMIKKYTMDTPDGKKLLHDSDTIASFFDEMVEEDKVNEKTRLSDLVRMFNRWVG